MAYWQDYPPTHVLVAAYLTGGSRSRSSKRRHGNNGGETSGIGQGTFNDLALEVAFAGGTVNKSLPEIYRQRQN